VYSIVVGEPVTVYVVVSAGDRRSAHEHRGGQGTGSGIEAGHHTSATVMFLMECSYR
jgi:hypothetical protein